MSQQTKSADEVLKRLANEGGAIVSSAALSEAELYHARACGRFYVDDDGFGYVLHNDYWRKIADEANGKRVVRPAELTDGEREAAAERETMSQQDERCAVCGWVLADSVDKGCVPGNCSLRPLPDHAYDATRAVSEGYQRYRREAAAEAPPAQCIHCGETIYDNGTVYIHRRLESRNGRMVLNETQWCDESDKRFIAEAEPAEPAPAPAAPPDELKLLKADLNNFTANVLPQLGVKYSPSSPICWRNERAEKAEAELEQLRQQVQEQESARQNYAKELAQLRQQRDFWQIEESRCKESLMRLETERAGLRERVQSLTETGSALLRYLDDHDWGTIPEGETADKFRAALREQGK